MQGIGFERPANAQSQRWCIMGFHILMAERYLKVVSSLEVKRLRDLSGFRMATPNNLHKDYQSRSNSPRASFLLSRVVACLHLSQMSHYLLHFHVANCKSSTFLTVLQSTSDDSQPFDDFPSRLYVIAFVQLVCNLHKVVIQFSHQYTKQ